MNVGGKEVSGNNNVNNGSMFDTSCLAFGNAYKNLGCTTVTFLVLAVGMS